MQVLIFMWPLSGIVSVATGGKQGGRYDAFQTEAVMADSSSSGSDKVMRVQSVIGVKKEALARYKELHAAVWPAVLERIKQCNMQNYSIALGQLDDDNYYLFSYFEYVGDDFEGDMAAMAADPVTQQWWAECKPCQQPCRHRGEGAWWMDLEEVFFCE